MFSVHTAALRRPRPHGSPPPIIADRRVLMGRTPATIADRRALMGRTPATIADRRALTGPTPATIADRRALTGPTPATIADRRPLTGPTPATIADRRALTGPTECPRGLELWTSVATAQGLGKLHYTRHLTAGEARVRLDRPAHTQMRLES